MHIGPLLKWWYGAGWSDQLSSILLHLRKVSDAFSIPLLLKTLFQPFRQIGTDSVRGPLEVRFRAFLDKIMSRLIGAMVRTGMIIFGGVWWLMWVIFGAVWLLAWPFLPVMPLIGLAMSVGVRV